MTPDSDPLLATGTSSPASYVKHLANAAPRDIRNVPGGRRRRKSASPSPEERPVHPNSPVWQYEGVVLVIDDEQIVLTVQKRILGLFGFKVFSAISAAEGLEILQNLSSQVDVIIMDLLMPEMDGVTAFPEISKLAPGIPVIATSGQPEISMRKKYMTLGFAEYLEKPFKVSHLAEKLQRVLKIAGPEDCD